MFKILFTFLALIIVGKILLNFSNKRAERIDAENANRYSKEEHEFFEGKNKPEMYIDFKGNLIEADEHFSGLINDQN